MIPPGSFLPLFLLISGSSNSAGTHLRGCTGLWSISRGYGREHWAYLAVSPTLTVTVGSLAIVHLPTNLRTALFASETLFLNTKGEEGRRIGRNSGGTLLEEGIFHLFPPGGLRFETQRGNFSLCFDPWGDWKAIFGGYQPQPRNFSIRSQILSFVLLDLRVRELMVGSLG